MTPDTRTTGVLLSNSSTNLITVIVFTLWRRLSDKDLFMTHSFSTAAPQYTERDAGFEPGTAALQSGVANHIATTLLTFVFAI